MAAGAFTFYDNGLKVILDGTIDLDTDTLAWALLTTTHVPATTDSSFADLDNELSHASYTGGSTSGGIAVASPAITQISGKQHKFSSAPPTLTFNTTDASFRYAVLFERNATPANAKLVGYIDLNTSGANVTVTAGNAFTMNVPTNGWFNWTQP
jgi:hypothetical protein